MTGNFPAWNAHIFPRLKNYINQSPPMSDTLLFPIEKDEICGSLINFASKRDTSRTGKHSQDGISAIWKDFAQNGRECEDAPDIQAITGYLLKLIDTKKHQFLPSAQHMSRKMRRVKKMQEKLEMSLNGCVFCKNNDEPNEMVHSHVVRDSTGKVTCPVLRSFKCPICGVSGDNAHTVKYCPKKPIITMRDTELAECARIFQERYACY